MKYIRVKVFPECKSEKIEKLAPDRYRVYLREAAKNNIANKRLLQLISEQLDQEHSKLRIISGHRYQNKIIQIL